MEPQVLKGSTRSRRIKSALTALGLLSVATLALAIALYLWTQFDSAVPAINWYIAVLCGFTTIGLAGAMVISRASPKTVLLITAVGAMSAAVGFLWGPLGIFIGVVAGNVVTRVVAWRWSRASES